ncbi:13601_t:CDS:2 [Acaulospora morrowiae]|uniref:13601_t:CDS:1 n=1 Tax=Acaulospora morrowiae TaxID=94023 RepID=A0A9N8VRJ0_9GLOM|nr:13601_t:CDS:2 [Acaulospora morrowiae]
MDHSNPNVGAMVKAKRKRANPNQLKVLNEVFQQTFFPSTEQRIQLGKQLGMSPRTVQIWFQNKRQSWRSKTRATSSSPNKDEEDQADSEMVNGKLPSRRSSNSSLSSSDDEDLGQRSIPDSPLDTPYHLHHRGDYFSHGSQMNSSSESVNPPSSAINGSSSYFTQQSSPPSDGDYYRSNGHVMSSGAANIVSSSPSSLPPPLSMTAPLPPFGQSPSNNTPGYSHGTSNGNGSFNNRLPAPILTTPFTHHRHHLPTQPQPTFGYQSAVTSGI